MRDVRVAKRSKEGPLYLARQRRGVSDLRVAVKLVRGAREIGRNDVQELRKDLAHYSAQMGLVLAPGEAGRDARSEASAAGQAPVALYVGDALPEELISCRVGVTVQSVEVPDLDEAFLAALSRHREERPAREERSREERRPHRHEQQEEARQPSAEPMAAPPAPEETAHQPAPPDVAVEEPAAVEAPPAVETAPNPRARRRRRNRTPHPPASHGSLAAVAAAAKSAPAPPPLRNRPGDSLRGRCALPRRPVLPWWRRARPRKRLRSLRRNGTRRKRPPPLRQTFPNPTRFDPGAQAP